MLKEGISYDALRDLIIVTEHGRFPIFFCSFFFWNYSIRVVWSHDTSGGDSRMSQHVDASSSQRFPGEKRLIDNKGGPAVEVLMARKRIRWTKVPVRVIMS